MSQYIKIFVVRLSVTDVGVAVTNLRVVCKSITCVSAFTEIAYFLEMIVEAAAGLDTLRCRLHEGCHCGRLPSHYRRARTQDYLACWTRTRHDFHLRVTACREQGSHYRDERLGIGWVASQYGGSGLRAPARSSRKSWERTTTELTTFILWLINSPCVLTGSNL